MKLLIASDLVPTNINIELFNNGDVNSLLGNELTSIWNAVDERIINLETPLTDQENPIDKQGPNLIAPTSTIKGIKELKPTLITLANNHILDQDVQGFNSTANILKENEIPFTGAGDNLIKASAPYIIDKNGKKIGIYTCAENEFTIATEDSAGANPFDPLESLDHIYDLKSKCDYVIVLYHGGKEHYRYPSPYLQKVCRKIVDKGADLVICQHSHCVGSFELYEGASIVYGQGNFIFNKLDNEFWNTSLLVQVDISNELNVSFVPIMRTDKGVKLATDEEADEIMNDFYNRSKQILQKGFIEKEYKKYANEYLTKYLKKLAGFGKWKTRMDRRLFGNALSKRKYKKQNLLAIRNYIECEAHRELLLKGLEGEVDSGR